MNYNFGAYDNPEVTALIEQLSTEFDTEKRAELAIELQQKILDDHAYIFCSFLQMNMISKSNVKNYTAHACDWLLRLRRIWISISFMRRYFVMLTQEQINEDWTVRSDNSQQLCRRGVCDEPTGKVWS